MGLLVSLWPLLAFIALFALVYAWFNGARWLVRLLLTLERRRGGLRSHTIEAAGLPFHILSGGRGPTLVLLHGFGGDADHWIRIAPFLRRHFSLVIPDLPGFGDTPLPAGQSGSMEAQAERLHALFDALEIKQAIIAGNSMGGYLAASFAWLYPHRVTALCLFNPGGLHSAPLTAVIDAAVNGHNNLLVAATMAEMTALVNTAFVRPAWVPRPVTRYLVRRNARNAAQVQELFEHLTLQSTPLEDMSARIKHPTLVLWGGQDRILDPRGGEILTTHLANAKLIVMPQTGHCPMIEAPRITAGHLCNFVNSIKASLT